MSDVSLSDNEEDVVENEEEVVENNYHFEGPYPERLVIPLQYMKARSILPDELEAGVNLYYEYVDMVYDMFFKKKYQSMY